MPSAEAERWMVATSHPLAVDAALEVLEEGGNAVDAAVTAAAMLAVTDPRSTGIGGDAFGMYWGPGTAGPVGLAAAGPAPAGLSMEAVRGAGFEAMPEDGPWTVTVPGAVAGWQRLLDRFGTVDLGRALAPAIAIADEGFQVTRTVAADWNDSVDKLKRYPYSASVYLCSDGAPAPGTRMTNPDLATSLRAIAAEGPGVFYQGWIAERIESAVAEAGGPLRAADISRWSGPTWVAPLAARFRDIDVFELPPPNQGIVALQALKLYEAMETASVIDEEHAAIECLKLAFADAARFVADPGFYNTPVNGLLSEAYLARRRALVDVHTAGVAESGTPGDTVYVAVMKDGEGCSFIQSLYAGFGSGVGVEGTGIVLQNRGAGFVVEDGHPNRPEPNKRPYHTIIPAMLGRDGTLCGCLGVVGGFMQPQGHLQVLRNLLDRGHDPQTAVSLPRFRVLGGRRVAFEPNFDPAIVSQLRQRGHETSGLSTFEAGGAQIVVRLRGRLVGGSDPRKDGLARGA